MTSAATFFSSAHPDWLVPQWPAPAHVHALCTTRAGGVSTGAYAGLNLGNHVNDEPAAVATNRAELRRAIQADISADHSADSAGAGCAIFLQQVHGIDVLALDQHTADGLAADAAITAEPGVACTVMVADCLPVLFTLQDGSLVGAAHAGWRGLSGVLSAAEQKVSMAASAPAFGILESTVAALKQKHALAQAQHVQTAINQEAEPEILAWLGPCIGPTEFEVGAEVRDAFCANDKDAVVHFVAHGNKFLADLPALARRRLRAMGITQIYGNDGSTAWCTVSNPSQFFSFRRDQSALGGSGRFAACIWRD